MTFATTATMAPNPATIPNADVFSESGTMVWILSPSPTIAGPNSATKNTNWAINSAEMNRGPTCLSGRVVSICVCPPDGSLSPMSLAVCWVFLLL